MLGGSLSSHMSLVYGIYRNSILNSSSFFHVVDGLAPDIMHDVLEGSLQYEVKELLKYVIYEKKWMTLAMVNEKIDRFPYMQSDKANKPAIISDATLKSNTHGLKQKGSNNTCVIMCIFLCVILIVHKLV